MSPDSHLTPALAFSGRNEQRPPLSPAELRLPSADTRSPRSSVRAEREGRHALVRRAKGRGGYGLAPPTFVRIRYTLVLATI